ncbi:MAG: lyase family protein [Nitrososphaerota archaeon]
MPRMESDYLGEVLIPDDVYWGAQTQRALENFNISGLKFHPEFVKSTALVKLAAVEANMKLGRIDKKVGKAIAKAAREVADGKLMDQFVLDVFQAGAGTSHNMNANEVIAGPSQRPCKQGSVYQRCYTHGHEDHFP